MAKYFAIHNGPRGCYMPDAACVIREIKDCARAPWAWPGGYPKFLVMVDGGALCPACVKAEFRLIARATRAADGSGWHAVGGSINWEDGKLDCDHCGARIPSAYAEDGSGHD